VVENMRGVIKFVLTLVLVFVLAWLGLWWYAQGRLQNGFSAWAEQQAANGVTIAYSGLQRGTSPTEALLTISNLTITFPAIQSGAQPVITLPSLNLRLEALSPTILHLDLPNKITFNGGGNLDLAMNAGSISQSDDLDPNALFNSSVYPFRGGDFSAGDVDILASSGSLLVLHMDSIAAHADFNLAAGAGQTALNETFTMNGMALSPLVTHVASIPFEGKINQFGFNLNLSGPVPPQFFSAIQQVRAGVHDTVAQQKIIMPVIHQWASQGGTATTGLNLAIGPSTASADAAVKFDANLQPTGTANLTADHLDEFTTAITTAYPQFAPAIAGVLAQLTPYITTTTQTGQTLTMHAIYGTTSGVTINGTKITDMPPVDWTTLENPAPPPSGQ
jgi:hypothetical protein